MARVPPSDFSIKLVSEALLGRSAFELLPKEIVEPMREAIGRALASGEAVPLDLYLEPSAMTRGMPLPERRALERELAAGRVLRVPDHLRP